MSTRRRKLLLADDSPTVQKVVSLTFSDEGVEVVSAGSGEQALALLAEGAPPDIVLADIFMPGPNGYEVCERIKGDPLFRHIPVVLLVGTFEPFNEAEARRVGADDVLTKPFQSIKDLVSRVGSLFGGAGRGEEERAADESVAPSQHKAEAAAPPRPWEEPRVEAREAEAGETEAPPVVASAAEASFADLAHDDQMIEARPVDLLAGDEETHEETRAGSDDVYARHEEEAVASAQVSQSFAASAGAGVGVAEEVPVGVLEEAPAAQAPFAAQARASAPPATGDEVLLDLGDADASPQSSVMDDFVLDLGDDDSFASSEMREPETFASPEYASATTEAEVETRADAAGSLAEAAHGEREAASEAMSTADAPQFINAGDEQKLTSGAGESDETPTLMAEAPPSFYVPEAAVAQEEPPVFSAPPQADEEPRAGETREASPADSRKIGLEQLSPEVIEAIARRAVEQMSDAAVREIAWEVVPQLAELLIKRRLDEERSRAS